MTIAAMEKLRECGWYLTEHGFDLVSDYGSIVEPQKMIKRAIEFDLKEISNGEGDISQGNVVLQIQKQRNVAAPKNNEESRGAPRMLKISFTDGKNSYQAIELEPISTISLNTPPGTKILIRGGSLVMSHGIILLRPQNIVQCLGGKVANLVEKWEINKKLASHSRVRPVEEGGPPPWIPFGKKIVKIAEQGKFKALAEKEKEKEENAEFEAQRKNAIAEAAKQGSKKVFGGGNKQLLDHSVQKIVDNGFTIEQAEYALKVSRNNVDKALKSLQRYDNKSSNSVREPREPREPKGKRGDKKNEEVSSKPSSGKISLFDFLEDKLPAQVENLDINNSQYDKHGKDRSDSYSDRHSKSNDHQQSGRGGGRNAHGRGYQIPPRHLENNRPNKFNSTSTTSAHGGTYNPTPPKSNKPPRFQRNQETQNFHSQVYQQQQQHHQEPIGSYNKFPQINEFHSMPPFSQSRQGASTPREYSSNMSQKNHPDYQSKNQQSYQTQVIQNSRNQNYGNNAQTYQSSTNASDRNFGDNQSNQFYKTANDNYDYNSMLGGVNISQKSSSYYNSNFNNEEPLGGTWVWRVGDRCMAKYWEDNMYYNAEVTAVSKTTCVVLFKDFHNYEEVLQIDCIPITEENPNTQNQNAGGFDNNRRVDQQYRSNNRPPRFEQNQNNSNTSEYRRGGGGSNKNNRRRNQQRSAQPIYQPPAQRGNVGAGNFSDT